MSFSKLFYLVPFMVLSFVFSNCPDGTDVCLSLDGGNLDYESTVDIAGFQFNHNGCVTSASGGDATDAGFTISASETVVLAFSFTGAVIPTGSGTLVVLEGDDPTIDPTQDCLVASDGLPNFIFSDADGGSLAVAFSEVAAGCTDDTACNYDVDAEEDDGSCEYVVDECGECGGDGPEENFDCDGNCLDDDSDGICNTEDDCFGYGVLDCNGVCGGASFEGCDGVCDSFAELDYCGVCEGENLDMDCLGVCFGAAELDDCGVCEGGNSDMDCFGECFGSAEYDDCGVCDGDSSTCEYACEEGVEVCLSLDGENFNYASIADIAGFQFSHNGCVTAASGGDATDAGFTISASGSAVLAFSFTGAVVPAGSGTLVVLEGDVALDCLSEFIFSDPVGESLVVGFPVVLVDGCTDDMACNYDPEANNNDGSCEYPEENFDCDGNCMVEEDCNGECGGTAVEDECSVCDGDGSTCTVALSLCMLI